MRADLGDCPHALIRVRIADVGVLSALRKLPVIDYVEPARILPPDGAESIWADSFCNNKPYDQPFTPYVTPQGDLISRVYGQDIVGAWARSTGEGITVAVVGTGVSALQNQLMDEFTNGQSGGRTLIKDATDPRGYPFPWHDECGHETKLIGYIAAPLDGQGVAGVAYRASIYSVRVDDDTYLGVDSQDVRLGIRRAASNYDIVAMAFGSENTRDSIEDEILYWSNPNNHADRKPPLFVGAAGTAYVRYYVMFPARMPEVTAVTGSEVNGDVCESCHRGEEVEFALFAHEPALRPDGGYGIIQGGGSSQGVATFSAMAALVWSRYPSYTADQVLTRLREASPRSFNGLGRDPRTGWGAPMISCAVGGLCDADIYGPTTVEPGEYYELDKRYTFSVSQVLNNVPVDIRWTPPRGATPTGSTSEGTVTLTFSPDYQEQYQTVAVTLTDRLSGHSVTAEHPVYVSAVGSPCGPFACEPGEI